MYPRHELTVEYDYQSDDCKVYDLYKMIYAENLQFYFVLFTTISFVPLLTVVKHYITLKCLIAYLNNNTVGSFNKYYNIYIYILQYIEINTNFEV